MTGRVTPMMRFVVFIPCVILLFEAPGLYPL